MLAEHPDVLKRLREETLQKIGPSRRPTYDDFRDMKYLRAVINGTQSQCWRTGVRNSPATRSFRDSQIISRCVSMAICHCSIGTNLTPTQPIQYSVRIS